MPGGDRTGPLGYGPMTGHGAGYCSGYATPGYVNAGAGRGRGFGGGRGWRHFNAGGFFPPGRGVPAYPGWTGYVAPMYRDEFTPEGEMEALKYQTDCFKKQIDVLNERISELEEIAAKKGGSTP